MDDKSDFSYKVEVSGYQPEEINVELQGNKIVVRAEYQEQYGDDDFVHHQFVRSVPIPAGINMGTFKCKMDNDGRHLCICAQRESAAVTRIIPIIFEQSEQPKKEIKLEIHH